MRRILTSIGKWRVRVSSHVSICKLEHESINLLCFSRETESLQECSQGTGERKIGEVHNVDKGMHDGNVFFLSEEGNEFNNRL